jgi:hypothetical protein
MNLQTFLFPVASPSGLNLRDVRRFFSEGLLDSEAVFPWAVGLGIIVGLLCLAMLVNGIRQRRRPRVRQDVISDPKAIQALFGQALDQRANFELQFSPGRGGRRPALRCTALRMEGPMLVLDAVGLKTLSDRWQGRSMEVFFHLLTNSSPQFYAFKSSLSGIQETGDYCLIRILIPSQVEYRQKRSYLRIIPPEEYLLAAALWHSGNMPKDEHLQTLSAWPKPSLIFLPAKCHEFSVSDISASGARIHISKEYLPRNAAYLKATDRIVFMLDLWDPDKAKRYRFWLLCRVQNPVLDFELHGLDIGLQFLSWARPRETGDSSSLEWLRLSGTGEVETLGNWIMRRHLEIFRDTETDPYDSASPPAGAAPPPPR